MSASVYNVGINRYHANFKHVYPAFPPRTFSAIEFLSNKQLYIVLFFPALKILTFSLLYNHDNWPLQSFVDLYNYIFNVIIVFLNKITNHTVPIFNFLSNENNSSILHWPLWNKFVYHFTNRRIITLKANGKWKS